MIEKVKEIINRDIGLQAVKNAELNSSPPMLQIEADQLLKVCQLLHTQEGLYFDFLQCISGVDNGHDAGTMEVIYHLHSIPYNYYLALQVIIPRPEENKSVSVPSVANIWRTANWLERETYDLLGIEFSQHPDLRRILLPADWKGYPLRKDYQVQEYYHGIKVD